MKEEKVVLLIEDNEMVARFLKIVLEKIFYKRFVLSIEIFENGKAAIERIRDIGKDIDLIITDYNLPGENGAKVIEAARRTRAGVPILGVSAKIEQFKLNVREELEKDLFKEENILDGLEGMMFKEICFLGKPFSVSTLMEVLGMLLK